MFGGVITRYTRYEYKKYGKLKFLCSIVIIVVISITGGLYVSKFIFKDNTMSEKQENINKSSEGKNIIENNMNIVALQCGYYANKNNAESTLNSLNSYCAPFIVEDKGKYRVIAGIYQEEDAINKMKELSSNGIEVAKIKMTLNKGTEEKCIEIMDGFFTIIKKLEEDDVKSIKTEDFKKWANNIIGNNKTKKLNSLSECINNLPDEIEKNNITDISSQLFSIINEE